MKKLTTIVKKPWGAFYDLAEAKGKWHVKIITIKKGHRLSLQKHAKRSEFLMVVEGKAKITMGTRALTLSPQKSTFIKKKEVHRMQALTDATIIEITFGSHDEKDIVRLADDYGRAGA